MSKFLILAYWLNIRPEPLSVRGQLFLKGLLGLLLIVLFLSLIYLNWKKRNKVVAKAVNKLALWSATMIFFGVLFYWVDYEGAPFFAARFWWLLWVIIGGWFLFEVVKFFLKEMPRQLHVQQQQEQLRKYLPRR
jgi:hypothetical protein